MPRKPSYAELVQRISELENELSLSDASLNSFFGESPAGFGIFDLEGRYLRLNETLAGFAGLSVIQHLGRRPSEFLPQPLAGHIETYVQEIITTGTPQFKQPFSCAFPDRPELMRHWLASRFPLYATQGSIAGVGVVVVEVTELHQARAQLARQETFHRTLLENIPARIFVKDCSGTYLYCNGIFAADMGLTQTEIVGKNDFELFLPDKAQRYRQADLEVISSGQTTQFEHQFTKNSRDYYIHVRKTPFRDSSGKILGILGIFQDLTEKRQAEYQLRIADHALAGTLAGIAICNPAGELTYANPAFLKMWGFALEEEILGRPITILCSQADAGQDVVSALHTQGEWQGELTGLKKNGSRIQTLLTGNIVHNEAGQPICLICSFLDITARKEAERKFRESEINSRQIIDNIDDAVWIEETAEQRVLYVSPAYERIWGRSRENLYANHRDWLAAVHPEDRARVMGLDQEIGTVKRNAFRIIRTDGTIRHVYTKIFPVVDENGSLYREVGIIHDVTEATQSEARIRELSRRLMIIAEEERKSIARDLHDEFGQVLVNFRQCQKNLLDQAPQAPSFAAHAAELDALIERLGSLIRYTTQRLRPDILDNLGLVPALEWGARQFANHYPTIKVSFQVSGRPTRVDNDQALVIYRVFQEALTNIAKHAGAATVTMRLVFSHPAIILSIADDGCGFDTNQFDHSDNGYQCLGLRGITERITAMNGRLRITSRPGQGTTLRVELSGPILPAPPSPRPSPGNDRAELG